MARRGSGYRSAYMKIAAGAQKGERAGLDEIFGTVSKKGARPVERLVLLRSFLKRLDTELPQVIVEALEEVGRITAADVAAIYEVKVDVLRCAFSTDPSLLEARIPLGDEREVHEHGSSRLRDAAGVADALCAMLYAGEREWVLLLGERNSRI